MSFFVELWESIFTPGPTPVILKATNATFAALQLLLLVLLYATYSIHFVALSVLCGGLWWSINWFAEELERSKREQAKVAAQEDEAGQEKKKKQEKKQAAEDSAQATAMEDEETRNRGVGQRQVSSASTEDEWEKVSQ